jgi:hypothetical protein
MDRLMWEEEKEKRRKESLETHARLHRLFVEDRLSFERERRHAIHELIDSVKDEEMKAKLLALQASWEKRMKGAGSLHNRFVLAQTFFWEHFHGVWNPTIQGLNLALNGRSESE